MKIVFVDQMGCFASVVAAAVCRGVLSEKANYRDILNLPYFADVKNYQPGQLYYMGKDQMGNRFYTLGVGRYGKLFTTVMWPEMLKISQVKEKIILYDVSSFNSVLLNFLEVLSKGKLRKISKYVWAYWFTRVKGS
ncbi:MAG: DUF3189 family protein [Peptococcia bacterium]